MEIGFSKEDVLSLRMNPNYLNPFVFSPPNGDIIHRKNIIISLLTGLEEVANVINQQPTVERKKRKKIVRCTVIKHDIQEKILSKLTVIRTQLEDFLTTLSPNVQDHSQEQISSKNYSERMLMQKISRKNPQRIILSHQGVSQEVSQNLNIPNFTPHIKMCVLRIIQIEMMFKRKYELATTKIKIGNKNTKKRKNEGIEFFDAPQIVKDLLFVYKFCKSVIKDLFNS